MGYIITIITIILIITTIILVVVAVNVAVTDAPEKARPKEINAWHRSSLRS